MWIEDIDKGNVATLHPLALAYMYYDDPSLFKWGAVNGICEPGAECIEPASKEFLRVILRHPAVKHIGSCHKYGEEIVPCIEASGIRYDGHIMYVYKAEVVLLNHVLTAKIEFKPPDTKYYNYAYIARPEYASTGVITQHYGVFYTPTRNGIIARYVSAHGMRYLESVRHHFDEAYDRIMRTLRVVLDRNNPWHNTFYEF